VDVFEWAMQNGERITASGLLLFIVIFAAIALDKKWIVPGWVYQECISHVGTLEEKVEARVKAQTETIERLEAELRTLREAKDNTYVNVSEPQQ